MKIPYQETEDSFTICIDGQIQSIRKDHAAYAAFKSAWDRQDIEGVKSALEPKKVLESFEYEKLTFVKSKIFYDGVQVHNAVVDRIVDSIHEGAGKDDVMSFVKFLVNLLKNPSHASREELYDFLQHKDLKITDDGYFLAYKGVQNDYWSVTSNKETRVLQGAVNEKGQIGNFIRSTIEVERDDVDDDRRRGCSNGIHVGAYDYAKGWGSKVVLVKVNPRDVVSVPTDCKFQKCRVCKYKVLEDYAENDPRLQKTIFHETETESEAEELELGTAEALPNNSVEDRVFKYVSSKKHATLRQIANSLSPHYVPVKQLLEIIMQDGRFEVGDADKLSDVIVYV